MTAHHANSPSVDAYLTHLVEKTQSKLSALVVEMKEFEAEMSHEIIGITGEQKSVSVEMNLLGDLVGIEISGYHWPVESRLGKTIVGLLMQGRAEAERSFSERVQARFPNWPSMSEYDERIVLRADPVDFNILDFEGPWMIRDKIAQALEVQYAIAQTIKSLSERTISQVIGKHAGVIQADLTGAYLDIDIEPNAIADIGSERLAAYLVEAIRRIEGRIASEQAAAFKRATEEMQHQSWLPMD